MMATRTMISLKGSSKASNFLGGKTVNSRAAVRPKAASPGAVQVVARDLWMPGSAAPSHLTGSLAGDYGFDPLGLGKNPEDLAWYVQAELVHARFAMLGAAGIMIPEALTKAGLLNVPVWYEAGATKFEFTNFSTLLISQLLLMGWAETKRYMDFKNPKSQGTPGSFLGAEAALGGTGENGYPGMAFDPFGYSKDPAMLAEMKVKEIANGRLAMMAMAGFYVQSALTGKGPLDNWLDHIADPFGNNVTTAMALFK